MFVRRLALFFLFLTLCLKAFPAVFTVTSNADSGPGTLRDALTQAAANGSAVQDIIQFNLSNPAITILSDLPVVSSNLIIDGSTQPSPKIGVSGARVRIELSVSATNTISHGLVLTGQNDIEIYGLLIEIPSTLSNSALSGISGIYTGSSKNIIIGAPGKGNVINNVRACIFFDDDWGDAVTTEENISENVKISSNILGLDETGGILSPVTAVSLNAFRIRNLTLGGTTFAEGNVFAGQVNIDELFQFSLQTGKLYIANNLFGTDYTGTKAIPNLTAGSTLGISCFNLQQLEIANNVVASQSDIGIDNINCFFKITGNKFGTDITGTKVLGTFQFPLVFGYCTGGGIIGGNSPGDQNIFAGAFSEGNGAIIDDGIVINIESPHVELVNNSFRCNYSDYPYQVEMTDFSQYFVSIKTRGANEISGTATPNSRVDLYYSLSCDHCEPEQLFQSVTADATGKWAYNGTLNNNNIIASSTINGTTSEFTGLRFLDQSANVKIKMECNNQKDGSIIGITTNMPTNYTWYDASGNVVSNTKDLLNVHAGEYHLVIGDGYCSITSAVFEIKDASNQINATNIKITPSSCNNNDGSITGLEVDPSSLIEWTDQTGNVLSTNIDLINIAAGKYSLIISTADKSCSQTYGPITINNVTGPNIDQSHAVITPTNCGQSTGSITNIQATGSGTLKYSWLNDQQQQVATTLDLVNQPAGTYKLQITDDSQCGSVFSTAIQIPETNGISLDESKVQTTIAGCGMNNGTITGMQVTGTAQYKWVDANSNIVATTIDFKNAAPGDYTFTAYNNSGCSKTSKTYHIGLQAVTQYPSYTVNSTPACYGQSNGSINISSDAVVASLRWVNSQGQNIGSSQLLNNVPKGTYQLYFTDANGCETLYNTYTVTELQPLSVASQGQVMSDQCGLKTGAINNIAVIGGQSPYTYTWTDAAGNQIGTGNSLSNLAAGDYHLNIADSRCGSLTVNYTITSQSEYVAAPSVSDVQLCSSGDAFISVNNPSSTFTYRLYDDQSNAQPLDEENSGRFKVTISNNRSYFISQLSGSCESSRSEIKVTVGVSAVGIPNAFTPNGDGINDYWSLKGMENNPNSLVQVFTRYGQKVFESKGYSHPFDGTYGGKELPAGVYYYIINLGTNCNILSGDVTIIR